MPQTKSNSSSKRQAGRRSDPKLFRCTGFGNCDMVFTRSEHLARHARKHTGEKPFRCVVPNCDRMFSRFDNMMQHTHTHNRSKKKDSSDSSDGRPSPMSVPEDNSMMLVPPMPNSPNSSYAEPQYHHKQEQSTHMYHPHMYYQQQQHLPPPSPTNEKEYLKYQHYYNNYPVQYMNQGQSRMCEGQPWPPVYYSPATPPQYHQQHYTATTVIPSPPQQTMADQEQHQSQPPHHPVTPADYNNNNSHNSNSVRKNSIHREKAYQHKRRMSYIELTTPIQELGSHYSSNHTTIATIVDSNSSSGSSSDDDDDDERQMSPISMSTDCTTTHNKSSRFKSDGSIDITADEYEALQGFGKFCTEPVIREPMLMTRITTSPTCSVSVPVNLPPLRNTHFSPTAVLSNNTTSQVHAFRQQIPTVQESFRRGGF